MLRQSKYTAKQSALRMLNRRAYSERELCQKLQSQGFNTDSINEVIVFLQERGYLDDNALCTMLFSKLSTSYKYSLKVITMKLKNRGISDSIISNCIKDYQEEFEFEAALKIVNKRYQNNGIIDQVKVNRYLSFKGFSVNTIKKIIDKIS